jgi:hypothetical protein
MSFSASDSPAMRLTDAAARVAMRLGDAELGAGVGQLDDDALLDEVHSRLHFSACRTVK